MSEVAKIDVGYPFESAGYSEIESGIRLVRGSNVKRGCLDWTPNIFAKWPKKDPNLASFLLDDGDVVIAMDGALVGSSYARISEQELPAYLVQRVARVRARSGYCQDLIYHLIGSHLFRQHTWNRKTNTAIPHISKQDIEQFEFPKWPLAWQTDVARVLSAADRAIQAADKLVEVKREFKRGLMQDLLTGRRRFPGFEGYWEECRAFGRRRSDWNVRRLGELGIPVNRKNRDESCDQVLTVSGAHGLIDQREYFSKIIAGDNRSEYYLIEHGEFAYNRSRMKGYRFGAIKRLDRYPRGVLSTLNICFALESDEICSDFLVQVFEAQILDRQLRRITQEGARAHGLLNVTKSDFMAVRVPVPTLREQELIVDALSTLDAEITHLESLATQLREQKRGLMQRLFSGELDLSALDTDAAPREVSA